VTDDLGPQAEAGADARFRLIVESVKDYAIFMLDPDGIIVSWNAGAEAIKGYSANEIIGRHFSTFYMAESVERGWPAHELEVAAAEGRFEEENWRCRKDGSQFWASVVITAMRDERGLLLGFSKVTRDLTERRRQETALRESEETFRLMLDGVRDYALVMLDTHGRVRVWHTGAEQILGYKAADIIGHHFSVFYLPDSVERARPIHQLVVAANDERFEEDGWRVRSDGTPFWANVMICALRNPNDELRGYLMLTRDISERKRLEILTQSTREMTEFLAMLSHELRNPLAPIRNAVEVLELSDNADPAVVWSRGVIGRQVTQLSRLVEDLLDVSRITSGKIALVRRAVDLREVVTQAVDACRAHLESRHHALHVSVTEAPLIVNGDLARLVQVATNLLSNAVKYTPDGGIIGVSLHQQQGEAVLRVTDNGAGMPPELLERVFDLFAQGERTLARSEGGLGVGLTLVRRLVELHDGAVAAMSSGAGAGSTLEVRIPAASFATLTDASDVAVPQPPSLQRILVVDDNADSATSMATLLALRGHQVRTAFDGRSALALLADSIADVVLLDIGLPGLSGYDVAREIRARPDGHRVVLCAMTGYGQDDDRQRARDVGFDHHLVKPVDTVALYRILDALPRVRKTIES
jgi:PAS domain S-box-containing protein